MASPATALPDHLLAEIFIRLPTPADLVRATAACVSFRRVAADRSFLRRFRGLHTPLLLGFVERTGFKPALPPHPSAPAALAVSLAADFSFSFLPSPAGWDVQDIRDGRVLLLRAPGDRGRFFFSELAMCDPLHRRYLLLPPIPDDLADSVKRAVPLYDLRPFLVSSVGEEEKAAVVVAEETSFRVIWMARREAELVAFVFSASTGQWRAVEFPDWTALLLANGMPAPDDHVPFMQRRSYAYGCFYWLIGGFAKMLVLDARRMELSIADLPPANWFMIHRAIVEAGEGRLGMFAIHEISASSELRYTVRQNNQWQLEKRISLGSGYTHAIKGVTGRYLLISRSENRPGLPSWEEMPDREYLSLDVKTLQLQRVCAEHFNALISETHIYTNFPPSLLSLCTI